MDQTPRRRDTEAGRDELVNAVTTSTDRKQIFTVSKSATEIGIEHQSTDSVADGITSKISRRQLWWLRDAPKDDTKGQAENPDSLDEFELGYEPNWRGKYALAKALLPRLIQITFMTLFLLAGFSKRIFDLQDLHLRGIFLNVDTQLAALGLLNKILDYLLEDAIEHATAWILTWWTAIASGPSRQGAYALDWGMKDENMKPWKGVQNFWTRYQLFGFSSPLIGRLFVSLLVSACVLLQGLAINTVAIPKERWYPLYNDEEMINPNFPSNSILHSPLMQITHVGWEQLYDQAYTIASTNRAHYDAFVGAAAASQVVQGITNTRVAANSSNVHQGFYDVYNDIAHHLTTLRMLRPSDGTILAAEALPFQNDQIVAQYNNQTTNNAFAKGSHGFNGIFNTTVPFLSTQCTSTDNATDSHPTNISLYPTSQNYTLATHFSSGVSCTTKIRQALFPLPFWITNGAATASISPNSYGGQVTWMTADGWNLPYRLLPVSGADADIAATLVIQLEQLLPALDGIFGPSGNASEYMGVVATSMRADRQAWEKNSARSQPHQELQYKRQRQLDSGDTAAAYHAPLVSAMLAQILAFSTWRYAQHPSGEIISSAPIRYQGYGSGPRQDWQYAVSAVLFGVMLIAVLGAGLAVRGGGRIGEWSSATGLANRIIVGQEHADANMKTGDGMVESIQDNGTQHHAVGQQSAQRKDTQGVHKKDLTKSRIYARSINGKVVIRKSNDGETLKGRTKYRWNQS